jgi:hypothetical protein
MSAATAQLESAPRHRWLLWARQPIAVRAPQAIPAIALAAEYDPGLAALSDPTLFALPHAPGFSGTAWKLTPRVGYVAADWSEPLRWLELPAEKLGSSFRQLLTEIPPPLALTEKTAPRLAALEFAADFFPLPTQTALRFEGELAGRELLLPVPLQSWSVADVLAASEVRVLVDAAGNVVSALLLAGCGLAEADERAVALTRAARFVPLAAGDSARRAISPASVTAGKMIFQWHTVAPAPEAAPNP